MRQVFSLVPATFLLCLLLAPAAWTIPSPQDATVADKTKTVSQSPRRLPPCPVDRTALPVARTPTVGPSSTALIRLERRYKSEEEGTRRDAEIQKYLLLHPHEDLLTLMMREIKADLHVWKSDPFKVLIRLPLMMLSFVRDIIIVMLQDLGAVANWIAKVVEAPRAAGADVKEYVLGLVDGIKSVRLMVKRMGFRTALRNLAGGFLMRIYHHSAKFLGDFIFSFILGKVATKGMTDLMANLHVQFINSNHLNNVVNFLNLWDDPINLARAVIEGLPKNVTVDDVPANQSSEKPLAQPAVQPFDRPRPVFSQSTLPPPSNPSSTSALSSEASEDLALSAMTSYDCRPILFSRDPNTMSKAELRATLFGLSPSEAGDDLQAVPAEKVVDAYTTFMAMVYPGVDPIRSLRGGEL